MRDRTLVPVYARPWTLQSIPFQRITNSRHPQCRQDTQAVTSVTRPDQAEERSMTTRPKRLQHDEAFVGRNVEH